MAPSLFGMAGVNVDVLPLCFWRFTQRVPANLFYILTFAVQLFTDIAKVQNSPVKLFYFFHCSMVYTH